MLPENSSYMIRGDDGEEYGPVDLEELREWVRENRAGLGTEVRRDEPGATWNSWQNYPELIALLAEAHATQPVPGPAGLTLAPIWRRCVAWLLDMIVLGIVINPLQLLVVRSIPGPQLLETMLSPTMMQALPTPVFLQLMALLVLENACLIVYFTLCHTVYGKTLGQTLLRVRVVNAGGEKPTAVRAFVRSLTLVLSVTFYVPLVYVFLNPQRRALHDVVSDTWAVNS